MMKVLCGAVLSALVLAAAWFDNAARDADLPVARLGAV